MSRELIDIAGLAAWFGKTPDAIRQMRYRDPSDLPPAIRIGKAVRWDPRTVEAWLKENTE